MPSQFLLRAATKSDISDLVKGYFGVYELMSQAGVTHWEQTALLFFIRQY